MIRPLLFAPLLLAIACRPNPPAEPPRVHAAAPASLVRAYRDTPRLAEDTWTGHSISCELAAGTYTVTPQAIHFHTGAVDVPPCIVWECLMPPTNNTQPVTVIGKCKGAVRDGVRRGMGVDFRITFEGCSVTVRGP